MNIDFVSWKTTTRDKLKKKEENVFIKGENKEEENEWIIENEKRKFYHAFEHLFCSCSYRIISNCCTYL